MYDQCKGTLIEGKTIVFIPLGKFGTLFLTFYITYNECNGTLIEGKLFCITKVCYLFLPYV